MQLVVQIPYRDVPECDYILGVLLGDWLGLSWRCVLGETQDLRITLEEQPGEIRLPYTLFPAAKEDWLTDASMPRRPLSRWDTRDLADDITLVEPVVPVIYGEPEPATERKSNSITLPVDIFGSAFFMLSRYEELVALHRDAHERFPAWGSLAYQEGFLERPIVDEYVEILWSAMKSLWPQLERMEQAPRDLITCDVDNPYSAYTKTWRGTLRKIGGDLFKRRNADMAVRSLKNRRATERGDYRHDPLWKFDWMMDVNERYGNQIAFFFLMDNQVPYLDAHYDANECRLRHLRQRMHKRDHEIGYHGSYSSFNKPDQIRYEVERLRRMLQEDGIHQMYCGGRQHYLRWSSSETPMHLDVAGLDYDSTLGFADRPGFRAGTCREYPLFDWSSRRSLRLYERPLILMECSILSPEYVGAGYTEETLDRMVRLKRRCHLVRGNFVVLWHNSYLNNPEDRTFYEYLISS